MPGETLPMRRGVLEANGVRIEQMLHFSRKDVTDNQRLEGLVAAINAMSGA